MLPDIQPGNTKILYFFNCLLDGMHTTIAKEQHPKRTDILYLGASTLSAAIQNLTSNIH